MKKILIFLSVLCLTFVAVCVVQESSDVVGLDILSSTSQPVVKQQEQRNLEEDLKNEAFLKGKVLFLDDYMEALGYVRLFSYKDCAEIWICNTHEFDIDYSGDVTVRIYKDEWGNLITKANHVEDGYTINYGENNIEGTVDYRTVVYIMAAAKNLCTSQTLREMAEKNRPETEKILYPE